MSFSLHYDLEGAGWAMATIDDGEKHLEVTISYVHDSLLEMAEAAKALRDGAETARVVFMDEPGETQLLLIRGGSDLGYELRWFDDWNSLNKDPDSSYKVLHSGVTTVAHFVGQVRQELEALLEQHGEAGYKDKWVLADFPVDLLRQLQDKQH